MIWYIFIVAALVVTFLIVGLALTLIVKGRQLQSDIGTNDEMKKRGIKCASRQILEEEAAMRGEKLPEGGDCDFSCGTCTDACDKR